MLHVTDILCVVFYFFWRIVKFFYHDLLPVLHLQMLQADLKVLALLFHHKVFHGKLLLYPSCSNFGRGS